MSATQKNELKDLKARLAEIEEREDLAALERLREEVQDLWQDVYVDRFDFWAGFLAYLYSTRDRLPSSQEVDHLFDQGAHAMKMKDKEGVRRCVRRLWELSPQDVTDEIKRGHGSGITI